MNVTTLIAIKYLAAY